MNEKKRKKKIKKKKKKEKRTRRLCSTIFVRIHNEPRVAPYQVVFDHPHTRLIVL